LGRTGLSRWHDLLEFWRLIRNTIHNAGVHLPPDGRARTLEFDGVQHTFVPGQLAEFATWPRIIRMIDLSKDMLTDVISSPQMTALPPFVDPTSPQDAVTG
jgi:hypothetical protein